MPTQKIEFSQTQTNYLFQSNARINIAHGSIRAGKNFIENYRVAKYLITEPIGYENSDFIFAGTTKDNVYRIILKDLFDIIGSKNYSYSEHKGKGKIFGRNFYVFNGADSDSYKQFRGSTIGGAYVTEGSLLCESFINELLARMSLQDKNNPNNRARLYIDTNPDSPYHWLHTRFIQNEELIKNGDTKVFHFSFKDNPSLTDGYKKSIALEYIEGSLLYKRMIQGLWVMADGIVYDCFNPNKNTIEQDKLPKTYDKLYLSIDYGTANPFVILLIGKRDNIYYVIDEFYYAGGTGTQKTDSQYTIDVLKFIDKNKIYGNPRILYLDPSALSFKTELRQNSNFKTKGITILDGENAVNDGIRVISSLMSNNRLLVSKHCKYYLQEVTAYIWDKSAQLKGEDKPMKKFDHTQDALRYCLYTLEKYGKSDLSTSAVVNRNKAMLDDF